MGAIGKSEDTQQSTSSSQSRTFLEPGQVPFFNALFGDTAALAGQQLGQIGPQAQQLAGQLGGQGNVLLDALSGQAQGGQQFQGVGQAISGLGNVGDNPLFQQLQGRAGAGGPGDEILQGLGRDTSLTDSLLGPNPALAGSLSALDQAIQQNLASTTGTIAGQATLQGATGGSRQALATGLAGQEAGRQFAQGASQLIGQDFANRQALAPQLQAQQLQAQLGAAQALNQGNQFGTNVLSQLLGSQLGGLEAAGGLGTAAGLGAGQLQGSAAQAGLGALSGLFNLGLAPFGAAFSPLLQASQIFGAPTVLSEQSSTGQGTRDASSFDLEVFQIA